LQESAVAWKQTLLRGAAATVASEAFGHTLFAGTSATHVQAQIDCACTVAQHEQGGFDNRRRRFCPS